MKQAPLRPIALAFAATLSLAACNFAPPYTSPVLPVPQSTASSEHFAVLASEAAEAFADAQSGWVAHPSLRAVVALALTHNRDLRIAVANVEKARAQYGIGRADLLPSVSVQGQASRSRNSADLSNNRQSTVTEQFTAQLGFTSYEIDFWGRVRNLSEAALQGFFQSEAQQRNVQIGLVAEVANAWLTLGADLARQQLAQDTLAAREQAFAMVQRMFELGATSGLVLAQSQTTVETARADVAAFRAQVARSRHALNLLVGGTVPPELLPEATLWRNGQGQIALLPVAQDVPSSVLLRRPDVQAAEHHLQAMQANIGAARAAMFPSITLTGQFGSGSRELDQLFGAGTSLWSFVPQIRIPIFAGGRLRAGVEVAEANQRIALAQYEKTVQTAFKEVLDVLADRAEWQARIDAQSRMVAASQKTFDLSQARFQAGTDNYLTVLDAQRSWYAAQQALINLQLGEQINRVTWWKVLGGR